MKKIITTMGLAAFVLAGQAVAAEKGFEKIFDGKTLKGWNGNPKLWSVKDGAITGQTTKENPTKGNTFIIWEGKTGNFDLRLDYKIIGGLDITAQVPNGMLVCATEVNTREEIDRLAGALAEIGTGK